MEARSAATTNRESVSVDMVTPWNRDQLSSLHYMGGQAHVNAYSVPNGLLAPPRPPRLRAIPTSSTRPRIMRTNPYRRMEAIQNRNRRAVSPWGPTLRLLGPLALGLAAAPLARPVLLWFLDAGDNTFLSGLGGITLRLALVLCGLGLLASHDLAIRGPDRRVLDPHPIQPAHLLPVLRDRLLHEKLGTTLGFCGLLTPLLLAHPAAFLLASLVLFQGWLCGIGLGFVSQLAAVWATRSPHLEAVFEVLRGANPRMQAALIYAPGLAIGLAGGVLYLATWGLQAVLEGGGLGLPALMAPLALMVAAWVVSPPLAQHQWYPATMIVQEVDAAWEHLQDPEEARRVYLDWAVRWFPGGVQPHLLRSLRQAWRDLRPWGIGAWGIGVLALIAGWTEAPSAPQRVLILTALGVVTLAGLAIRMAERDPPWLGRALPMPIWPVVLARGVTVLGYLQGAIIPGLAAVLVRHPEAFPWLALRLEAVALLGATMAAALSPLRRRAWWLYAPGAMLVWTLTIRFTG